MARFGKINKRSEAIVVAASDTQSKAGADYVCPAADALDYITNKVLPQLPTGGAEIRLLAGTYYVNTNSKPIDLSDYMNVRIVGESSVGRTYMGVALGTVGTVLRPSSTSIDSNMITMNSWSSDISIENMVLIGYGASGAGGYGIRPGGFGNAFRNLYIQDFAAGGIYLGYPAMRGGIVATDTLIDNCVFYSSKTADMFYAVYEGRSAGTVLSNSHIVNAGAGYYDDTTYGGSDAWILNNWFDACGVVGDYAVRLPYAAKFMNNLFWNTHDELGASTLLTDSTGYGMIDHNTFHHGAMGALGAHAIDIVGVRNTFTNNFVDSVGYNVTNTYDAVRVAGDYNILSGNTIYNPWAPTNTHRYGIYIISGEENQVFGNYLTDAGTADFYDTGTNTMAYRVDSDVFGNLLAEDTDYIVDAYDLNTGDAPLTATLTGNQPDVPRNVTVTVTDAAGGDLVWELTVAGVDSNRKTVEEEFSGTGSGSSTGSRPFDTITSVTVDTNTNHAAGDLLDVGIGKKLGISGQIAATSDCYRVFKNGSKIATPADYSISATYYTVDLTALAAADDVSALFRRNLNTLTWA